MVSFTEVMPVFYKYYLICKVYLLFSECPTMCLDITNSINIQRMKISAQNSLYLSFTIYQRNKVLLLKLYLHSWLNYRAVINFTRQQNISENEPFLFNTRRDFSRIRKLIIFHSKSRNSKMQRLISLLTWR